MNRSCGRRSALLLLVAAPWVGTALLLPTLSGCLQPRPAEAEEGAARAASAARPSAPERPVPTAVAAGGRSGESAKVERRFTLVDAAAIKKEIRARRGRAVVVHFWASWCFPCLDELPAIDRFAQEMRPRGVDVLSISLDDPDRAADQMLATLKARAPSLTPHIAVVDDPDRFVAAFGAGWDGSIPALFVYDRKGELRRTEFGVVERSGLEALVSGLPAPRAR